MSTFQLDVSPRIKNLVEDGVITVGAFITRDGNELYARSVQPHPKLGIVTHKSYTLEEIEGLLIKVGPRSLPEKGGVRLSADDVHTSSADIGPLKYGFQGFGDAASHGSKLRVNKAGVINFLPKDSITPYDLGLTEKDIFARMCQVTSAGSAKFVSKIASDPVNFRVKGASDLAEWWRRASPTQRVLLLVKTRHFEKTKTGQVRIHGRWLDRVQEISCPFQDAETQVDRAEEEYSESEVGSESDPASSPGEFIGYAESVH